MKQTLRKLLFVLLLLGLDIRRIARAFTALPKYLRDRAEFRRASTWKMGFYPCLYDVGEQSGTLGEYFWQDLYIAKQIIQSPRGRHIDVGSRVDGFIAHLAACMPVEIFDIRPLALNIPNVTYQQWDMTMELDMAWREIADSLSCLHTIEHVGLGRYGDPIDPTGWQGALVNLAAMLKQGGDFWLSVPVGIERVEFNAHRVFSPFTINELLCGEKLELIEFASVDDKGVHVAKDANTEMLRLSREPYALGIFHYRKQPSHESYN
jgi:hypothetical protein